MCLCTVGKNVGNCEEIKHQNVVNFQCASNICISTWKVISDLGKIEKKILNKGRGYTYLNSIIDFDYCVHTKMEMNLT